MGRRPIQPGEEQVGYVTPDRMASHLFLSRRALAEYQARGVIPGPVQKGPRKGLHPLIETRRAYILHLRERATGKRGPSRDGPGDERTARARKLAAQADQEEMAAARMRGELVPYDEALAALAPKVKAAHEMLRALVPKFRRTASVQISAKDSQKLEALIDGALRDLAEFFGAAEEEDAA